MEPMIPLPVDGSQRNSKVLRHRLVMGSVFYDSTAVRKAATCGIVRLFRARGRAAQRAARASKSGEGFETGQRFGGYRYEPWNLLHWLSNMDAVH
jgi:hypothetical protein